LGPDGRQLAFDTFRLHFPQRHSDVALYIVNADGSGLERLPPPGWPDLTWVPALVFRPVGWSPDGGTLFYVRDVYDGDVRPAMYQFSTLYRIDLKTLARSELRTSNAFYKYVLAPTGTLVAGWGTFDFMENGLLLLDSHGISLGMLWEPEEDVWSAISEPTWLGGDKALLFVEDRDDDSAIRAIDVQTRDTRELAPATEAFYYGLAVSRDGKLVGFVERGADENAVPTLRVIRADDGENLFGAPVPPAGPAAEVKDFLVYLDPQS
jgi:hypothetical protein